MTLATTLYGTRKRAAAALALRIDRRISGRGERSRRYRRNQPGRRPVLTRAEAFRLWSLNRRQTAASLRRDRQTAQKTLDNPAHVALTSESKGE